MMDNGFYTYLWLREDGTPYYVGKGRGKRAFRCGAPPAERVIIQYHPSERDALVAEVFFIAYYGRKDLGTGCLRNYTDGGDGVSGAIRSAETKEKISANHVGMKGKVHSDETKAKIRLSRLACIEKRKREE
jgi:hypothetical protein